jgi:hypothetical protein
MNARRVHAVLAHGVRNPDHIERWRQDPAPLVAQGIEPGSLDLPALLRFAGLTAKVRHNNVRNLLPMTFRFMAAAGFEIDLFSNYASLCSARGDSLPPSNEERAAALIRFIEHWLQPEIPEHLLLWDLIRHESALFALSKHSAESPAAPPIGQTPAPSPSSIAERNGLLILHELRSDPRELIAMLNRRNHDWSSLPIATRYFGYWRPDSAEAQILELDEFSFYALSYADDARTAAALSRLLTGQRRPSRGFLRLLGGLASHGLLRFRPSPRRTGK